MFQEVGMEEKLSFPDNVVFREEPEGGILFNVDNGDMKVVDGVAWGICDLIEGGTTKREVLEELGRRYPGQNDLERDLEEFLGSLLKTGMLLRA